MANVDTNKNIPYTVNQISQEKPSVPRTDSVLSGYIGNSMNGGHNRTIHFKKVMAGEKHKEYKINLNMSMLTPLTPPYQRLKCTLRAYFVPNSRVWTNAEKYTAQKGGASETKITEIPNLGGKNFPFVTRESTPFNLATSIQNTDLWRDCWISSYIPRIRQFSEIPESNAQGINAFNVPKVSVLPLRGRIAIYNDMERNKEYDEEIQEFKDDTVSDTEWNSYLPLDPAKMDINLMRARRENSYYTDYRTDIQGFELEQPTNDITSSLIDWASWESKIAAARSQAENAQKNDWQIIAELRGSKVLTEGKVQLIGKKTFDMNYSAITQSAYNTNDQISEEFQVMGKQGAYSFTQVNLPIYAGVEFIEEGYVHIIATVTADSVFETAIDRNELNVTPLDEYRPDLITDKFDVLKKIELDGSSYTNATSEEIVGFKRKFSEYFKLNNIIAGDMTTTNYFAIGNSLTTYDENEQIITQKTYQFFEPNAYSQIEQTDAQGSITTVTKKIWKDYTDLLINKNQAIKNYVTKYQAVVGSAQQDIDIRITGQNQIFFAGMVICLAELPIDQSIKDNYTVWGEH